MKTLIRLAMLALWAIPPGVAAGEDAPPEKIPMAPEVLLPAAGVAISVPASLKRQIPSDRYCALAAATIQDEVLSQTVSLRVYPIGPQDTDKSVMDKIVEGTRKTPGIRDLRELSSMPMPLGDLEGSARLFRYTIQDRTYIAARVRIPSFAF